MFASWLVSCQMLLSGEANQRFLWMPATAATQRLNCSISHFESAAYVTVASEFGCVPTKCRHLKATCCLPPVGFGSIYLVSFLSHVWIDWENRNYKLSATRHPHLVNLTTHRTDLQWCLTESQDSGTSEANFTDRAVALTGFSLLPWHHFSSIY